MRVDQPLPGGTGNCNTGNVARRAFDDPEKLARVTNINLELLQRLQTILIAINCSEMIDPAKFRSYCKETWDLYVIHYKWYKMPSTLHRILVHGPTIIENSTLPLGVLNEEGTEARNKHHRSFRAKHTRKISKNAAMFDLMRYEMIVSDPKIIALSKTSNRKVHKVLPDTVKALLIDTGVPMEVDQNSEDLDEFSLSEDEIDETIHRRLHGVGVYED